MVNLTFTSWDGVSRHSELGEVFRQHWTAESGTLHYVIHSLYVTHRCSSGSVLRYPRGVYCVEEDECGPVAGMGVWMDGDG